MVSPEQIDRDRRKREDELAWTLLLLCTRARYFAASAIRHGQDPATAASWVILGNPSLDLPGAAKPLTRKMIESHAGASERIWKSAKVTPQTSPQPEMEIARYYAGQARNYTNQIDAAVRKAINQADFSGKSIVAKVRELPGAFDAAGAGPVAMNRLTGVATDAVLNADSGGTWSAVNNPQVKPSIAGLHYIATLDKGTTRICRAYDGTKLHPDHAWWRSHWPLCHYGCRSMVLPIIGEFEATKEPPLLPPPDDGFGIAPFVTGLTRGPLAA